jgi:hypothetical protein
MIFTLFTLAIVGTASAQNPLFSFASNKMRGNHDVSLASTAKGCTYDELRLAASYKPSGQEFDCIKEGFTWHCKALKDVNGYWCQGGDKHTSLFTPKPLSLASSQIVSARSKGAVVSASSDLSVGSSDVSPS